jgi:hypothetical protein
MLFQSLFALTRGICARARAPAAHPCGPQWLQASVEASETFCGGGAARALARASSRGRGSGPSARLLVATPCLAAAAAPHADPAP